MIELYLQWKTNSKSYTMYRTASYSAALNDPYPQFQSHIIIWCWISQKQYEIHSFNGILIGTYTCPNQLCHFEWSWVTLAWLREIYNDMKCCAVSLWQLSFLLNLGLPTFSGMIEHTSDLVLCGKYYYISQQKAYCPLGGVVMIMWITLSGCRQTCFKSLFLQVLSNSYESWAHMIENYESKLDPFIWA